MATQPSSLTRLNGPGLWKDSLNWGDIKGCILPTVRPNLLVGCISIYLIY